VHPETRAGGGQPVEVGGVQIGPAVAAEPVPQVVAVDVDDVRSIPVAARHGAKPAASALLSQLNYGPRTTGCWSREWGVGGSVGPQPGAGSGGPSLHVSTSWGEAASGVSWFRRSGKHDPHGIPGNSPYVGWDPGAQNPADARVMRAEQLRLGLS